MLTLCIAAMLYYTIYVLIITYLGKVMLIVTPHQLLP